MKNQTFKTLITLIKRRFHRFVLINFVIIFGILFFTPVYAEDNIDVNLRIETPDRTILNQSISVPESCEVTDSARVTSTFTGHKAICVLQSAQEQGILSYQVTNWGIAFAIDSINEFNNASDWSETWLIYKNNVDPNFGIDGFGVKQDDTLLLTYGSWPMEPLVIELPTTTTYLEDTLILSTKYWNNGNLENYTNEITFIIDNTSYTSVSGTLNYTPDTDSQKEIYIETVGKTRSEKVYLNVVPAPEPEPEIILATTTIHLQIETYDATLFNDNFVVTECPNSENSTTTTLNIWCAIQQLAEQQNLEIFSTWSDYGVTYDINQYKGNDFSDGMWWGWYTDYEIGPVGVNAYELLKENEQILLVYGTNPLKIETSTLTPELNTTTTISIKEFDSWNFVWLDSSSSTIIINENEFFNEDGIYELKITTTTAYEIYGKKNGYLDTNVLHITPTNTTNNEDSDNNNDDTENSSGGGSSNIIIHNNLDIDLAINFLSGNENNGTFGSSVIYTDWAAIAFGAYDKNHQTAENIKDYLLTDPNPLIGLNNVSDYARRAMALMSLGINPYSDTATNYISNLVGQFDGNQFGDVNLYNDDIFAIIPLLHAGYNSEDEIINKTVQFILSKQSNGGWGSVDLTAAAIQSLSPLTNITGVSEALLNAKNKLQESQTNTGSFGNTPATSWVMQAINSLGENQVNWQNNNKTSGDYLYSVQASDGGLDENITNNDFRIWNTAYAIPAALGKTWNDILHNFSKPTTTTTVENTNSNFQSIETPTTTLEITTTTLNMVTTTTEEIVTTTLDFVTTTLEIATTTEEIIITTEITTDNDSIEQLGTANTSLNQYITTPQQKPQLQATNNQTLDDNNSILQLDNTTIPTTSYKLEAVNSPTPTNPAKTVFGISLTITSGAGLYLAWRILQTLI